MLGLDKWVSMWLELIWCIRKGLQDGTNYYTLHFLFLCPISNIENIFMQILVFRPFQSSSPMITSQTTCMVKRRGRYSFNTHGTILKSCWRGWRLGGKLSIATGLKLRGHSTSLKAQYLPSASAVSQMRFICLFTVYDATFQSFSMLHVKLGAVV